MTKEEQILDFLDRHVFEPAMSHPNATPDIRAGVRMTRMRMAQRDAGGMRLYFWTAIAGTVKSVKFARQMRELGLSRFEEVVDEFRARFDDDWLLDR